MDNIISLSIICFNYSFPFAIIWKRVNSIKFIYILLNLFLPSFDCTRVIRFQFLNDTLFSIDCIYSFFARKRLLFLISRTWIIICMRLTSFLCIRCLAILSFFPILIPSAAIVAGVTQEHNSGRGGLRSYR